MTSPVRAVDIRFLIASWAVSAMEQSLYRSTGKRIPTMIAKTVTLGKHQKETMKMNGGEEE